MILANGNHRFAFVMPDDLAAEMVATCGRLGQPLSTFIRRAVEAHLAAIAAEQPSTTRARRKHVGERHPVSASA